LKKLIDFTINSFVTDYSISHLNPKTVCERQKRLSHVEI
jgi:hypothetical protein